MSEHGKAVHLDRVSQLRSLTDRLELQEMISRLAAALDEHRFDDLRALFLADATVSTPGGTARGPEAVVAQAARNHEDYDRLQHLVSGVVVDLDGDRAAVRANLVGVFGKSPENLPSRVLGGLYRFGAARTDDGWRFASLDVRAVWFYGDVPVPAAA
jgi:3-phenylpropionate/cinnamic acid dioxygenase small subunit